MSRSAVYMDQIPLQWHSAGSALENGFDWKTYPRIGAPQAAPAFSVWNCELGDISLWHPLHSPLVPFPLRDISTSLPRAGLQRARVFGSCLRLEHSCVTPYWVFESHWEKTFNIWNAFKNERNTSVMVACQEPNKPGCRKMRTGRPCSPLITCTILEVAHSLLPKPALIRYCQATPPAQRIMYHVISMTEENFHSRPETTSVN